MSAYYNEHDKHAAAWLRELIRRDLIAPGDVDERSIEDVRPDDLRGYTQHHFFAGIGGWSYALRLAGWPDDKPVWTGSCPCQPFSSAGQGAGLADERHLWPAFHHLIRERRPAIIFGEQVAHKRADPWFDLVQADLDGLGYAFGCVPFPSAGVGAPQLRDRAYWVADAHDAGPQGYGGAGWLSDTQMREVAAGYAAPRWLGERIRDRAGNERLIEPGTRPLASRIPARVVRLRGYGNAVVAPAAQAFIESYLEVQNERVLALQNNAG